MEKIIGKIARSIQICYPLSRALDNKVFFLVCCSCTILIEEEVSNCVALERFLCKFVLSSLFELILNHKNWVISPPLYTSLFVYLFLHASRELKNPTDHVSFTMQTSQRKNREITEKRQYTKKYNQNQRVHAMVHKNEMKCTVKDQKLNTR